jgi:stage II sporulation protein D
MATTYPGRSRSALSSCLCALVLLTSSCAHLSLKDIFSGNADGTSIRVLILKSKESVTITGASPLGISGYHARPGVNGASADSITIKPGTISGVVSIKTDSPPLIVNGRPYRGSVEVRTAGGILQVINILKMDEYLVSVVPGEIPAGWEEEALKAQAVAARTFAYYHLINGRAKPGSYDMDATVSSQVYRGMADEKQKTTDAVMATAGEVIVYDDRPIIAYFHSTCGGKTTEDTRVWNKKHLPYLQGVTCGFCKDSTKFKWQSRLSLDDIRMGLSRKYRGIGAIHGISFRKKNDRVVDVSIRHSKGLLKISGNNFRLLFATDRVRSLYFTSKKISNGIELSGHGWGHGVGMCQWGARGMALKGYSYRDILKHYYTSVDVSGIKSGNVASKSKDNYDSQ